jgi:hypothetical protein
MVQHLQLHATCNRVQQQETRLAESQKTPKRLPQTGPASAAAHHLHVRQPSTIKSMQTFSANQEMSIRELPSNTHVCYSPVASVLTCRKVHLCSPHLPPPRPERASHMTYASNTITHCHDMTANGPHLPSPRPERASHMTYASNTITYCHDKTPNALTCLLHSALLVWCHPLQLPAGLAQASQSSSSSKCSSSSLRPAASTQAIYNYSPASFVYGCL